LVDDHDHVQVHVVESGLLFKYQFRDRN